MSRWSGEIEFDFVGEEGSGNFVATSRVVPMLTTLLAKGDVEGAMRLYEGSDAGVATELLSQIGTLSSTSQKNLAQMFFLARDFASAAKIHEAARRWSEAAPLYEKGGDFVSAARCYESEGDVPRAAAALERAGRHADAIALYQKSPPSDAMAECLARQNRYWEAAQVYQKLNNVRGEVEMLRLVPVTEPVRVTAVKRLGDLLERFGHLAPATQLLVETFQQIPEAKADRELLASLVRRLEAMGRHEHAERVRAFAHKQLGGSTAPRKELTAGASAPAAAVPGGPVGAAAGRPAPAVARAPEVLGEPPVIPAAAAPAPRAGARSSDPFADFVDPFGDPSAAAPAAQQQPLPPDPFEGVSGEPASAAAPAAGKAGDAYGHLKAIPIFGELALPDMKDLYRICDARAFPSGATIIEQGVQGAGLTVILQGSVQVLKVEGAAAKPLATLSTGAYVGEISLVDDAPTSARVVAQTPVRALFISRQRFEQFLYTHEAAALKIFALFTKTLAERLRQANKRA